MKTLLLSLMLLSFQLLFAQSKDTAFSSILQLRRGEAHTITVVHSKVKAENGKAAISSTIRYVALLSVVDSTADGYTLSWKFRPAAGGDSLSRLAGGFMEGLTITYKTNEVGAFKSLENWQEVRDFYVQMMMKSLPPNRNDSMDAVLKRTLALFNSKEMVETALIKEVKLFHTALGLRFSTKGTKQAVLLPTPFTQEPIPAELTSRVTASHPEYFVVSSTQTINKEASLKMFQQMFLKMGVGDVMANKQARAALASIQMQDESRFTIRTRDGLPTGVVFKRTVGAEGVVQVETYTIIVE